MFRIKSRSIFPNCLLNLLAKLNNINRGVFRPYQHSLSTFIKNLKTSCRTGDNIITTVNRTLTNKDVYLKSYAFSPELENRNLNLIRTSRSGRKSIC